VTQAGGERASRASAAQPAVSVCLPIYNEARFLRAALEALLGQTWKDFELIISDNASTDGTADICREFAARDGRIKYHRNEQNIGAAANFNRVIPMASGHYFLWAGGHDLWAPDLLERSVKMLENRPDAVVAVAACRWIGADDEPLERLSGFTDTSGMSSVERFFTILWGNMHPILGLMRTDALIRTAGVRACMGADLLLLAEMAFLGHFVFVPETHWYRREIRPQESYARMMARYRSAQYGLSQGLAARIPLLTLGSGLVAIAWRAPLPIVSRLVVCMGLAVTLPARYFGARLRRH
jgi:glycosyltransferase involved in cell wall biosynthesis